MVFQIQLAKRLETVPLTREYIGAREAMLRAKEGWRSDRRIAAE
jgi:cyclopropane-fatty-acyl-phospholipid synthase